MMVADNGSNWFISGAPDARWSNDDLHTLHGVPGSAFEVVDTSCMVVTEPVGGRFAARRGSVRGHRDSPSSAGGAV